MTWSIRRILTSLLKALLGLVVLVVLAIGGWITRNELTKRPPGSPPPGLEGREKYKERGSISAFSRFDNIPVDLWFGKKRDGRVDTTHLRIASDYIVGLPPYHGEYVEANVVWPSLRSVDEEVEVRKKNGQPYSGLTTFRLTLKETREDGAGFSDSAGTAPVTRCEPMIRDETRRVRHCNEPPYDKHGERWTNYWPLDESIRTPWYGNSPRINCHVVDRSDLHRDRCLGWFSYNADFLVQIDADEAHAIEILVNFPKLIAFLQTLEVKP